MIVIPLHIRSLKPYTPGKPIEDLKREKNIKQIVKLASNENPLGPSPKAIAALQKGLTHLHLYPNAQSPTLRQALADKLAKKPEQIICGSGIDSLLGTISNTFSEPGDEVLTSSGSFIGIYVNALKYKRKLNLVPLRQYKFDTNLLIQKISPFTRIMYIANPNNPTGSMLTLHELETFLQQIPSHILVILDEAYFSFSSIHPDFPNGLDFEFPNLIVTRTFSKDYGLAGLRIGYAIGPSSLITELSKVKLPFEPNALAQIAARAALEDDSYIDEARHQSQKSLTHMMITFKELGLSFEKPFGNFICLKLKTEKQAKTFYEACLQQGLILRHLTDFGLPHCVRISAGTDSETDFALDIITKVYKKTI